MRSSQKLCMRHQQACEDALIANSEWVLCAFERTSSVRTSCWGHGMAKLGGNIVEAKTNQIIRLRPLGGGLEEFQRTQ